MRREDRDPYAAPPRHKERSGAVVRLAVIAALLGAAAWGYMEYAQQPQSALVEPAEEQDVAENQAYVAQPTAPSTTGETPETTTPADVPEKAAEPPA